MMAAMTTATESPDTAPIDPLAGFRLDGKVAIVTGASSGIGARFARVLDALGATVVVSARRRRPHRCAGRLPHPGRRHRL